MTETMTHRCSDCGDVHLPPTPPETGETVKDHTGHRLGFKSGGNWGHWCLDCREWVNDGMSQPNHVR